MIKIVKKANKARDFYNPMRNLTVERAVALCESYLRGEYGELMWLFTAPFVGIESADADLMVLMERRASAVKRMDFGIVIASRYQDDPRAEVQKQALEAVIERCANLRGLIEHLELSVFRGYSACEPLERKGGEIYFRLVPAWAMVRDGSAGAWRYNPDNLWANYSRLTAENDIGEGWIIMEHERPIHRVALLKWVRQSLSRKDWDAFVEIYGIPGGVVILPPNVPSEEVADYLARAEDLAQSGCGALPNGATWASNDGPRGMQPFSAHLEFLQKELVLAATGGILTSLTASGSGTLGGGATGALAGA